MFVRFVLLLLLSGSAVVVQAQPKAALAGEQAAARAAAQAEQAQARYDGPHATAASAVRNLSFRNFVRGGIATGNLIQVPYVTNVNIAAGYWGGSVQPNLIQWPRNSGVEYGHTMSFIVAGEVVNDAGDTLRIVSDSYNRSGGDQAPSGSHKYFLNSVPGFYNMQGVRGTVNQLNNNPDDRQTLELAGYYFVGGLSEDANGNGTLDEGEDLNNNGQLDTELENRLEYTAQSNLPDTWPAFWPPQSYVGDDRPPCPFEPGTTCDPGPGVRAGRWNGAYGAFVRADQEAYYVADDRDNDEFDYAPFLDPATGEPDRRPWEEGGRRGLGVEVKVRQYQWASVLAEDIFIATLDVKNISRKDIPRAIVAMIVDYDIAGQTGDNEAFFDTEDDITYQWLKRDLTINGFKVGYAGVGFLESPGLADDGLDNDDDGLVDEDRADGIDNDGDWRAWVDVNGNGRYDNEDVNNNFILDDGEDLDGDGALTIEPVNDDVGSDGIGPEDENYPGPDADGTEANGIPDPGEPNFEFTDNDEIDQIGLTGMVIRTPAEFDRDLDDDRLFWDEYIQPGLFITPTETADIIYVYSSGITGIARGQEQRFSLAFFCGNDFQDMLRNKRTMQNIYDSDYNFARPPRTPFLTAVPGDRRVTLVWDQSAELSRDPIYGFDFEMYKVYRSTDPEFNDIKTITDAFGNPLLWEPLLTPTGDRVQFDLKNGLSGAHPVPVGAFGVSYDMGTDSGLQYSYVDSTVDNGRTYYYAVVSVDQGYHSSFYERGISPYEALAEISPTESSKIIEVDAFDRPVNVDRNAAVVVPQPPALGYVAPQLVEGGIRRESGDATGGLKVEFLIPDEANSQGYEYVFTFTDDGSLERLDPEFLSNGLTTGFTLRRLGPDGSVDTLAAVQRSTPSTDLFTTEVLRARTYDGMRFTIDNPVRPGPVRAEWLPNGEASPRGTPRPRTAVTVGVAEGGTAVPLDYEIRVSTTGADTSNSLSPANRIPTNFAVWDVTSLNAPRKVPFQLTEPAVPPVPGDTVRGRLSPGDVVNVRVAGIDFAGYRYYAQSTWRFALGLSENAEALLSEIDLAANTLYDSLAVRQVRGLHRRPFGPDLNRQELIPFFERIEPWYEAILDSLVTLGGLQEVIQGTQLPAAYLSTLRSVATHELPVAGDAFLLETSKPFDRDDVLRFKVDGHRLETTLPESALDAIYVVPDPYVAVNPLEARNVQLSGRGERRIDFRNLPPQCTIRIYTMSGRQVKRIDHQATSDRSIATWNLQSDDGLDVSFGVYIYHVEAPGIGERVGRFAIIK
ncbi:MAG: hypothetical protein D6685_14295 [Bacteroidetes bacterium]|nr:MAG: hypothetical protein D6685_14295 [Bacteroidota bacterium]